MNLGMLKSFSIYFLLVGLINTISFAQNYDRFTLIKKGIQDKNTLLIVGGIQGDEPGGFTAASLIATHYDILSGSVWIVPNLNFDSIIYRSRGRFGDMNRKFATISKDDPDYDNVENIKKLILDQKVSMIVNLHDGSGFYRKTYIDKYHSPYRWGQSSIIDQKVLKDVKYKNLELISSKVVKYINDNLISNEHKYSVKNTQTKLKDKEMAKSLTYYAITHNKTAFGNEASKNLPTHERTYYHLLALEKYMNIMGIKFKRKFKLIPSKLKDVIDNDISISFYDNKIHLPLAKIRNTIRYFPITKEFLDSYVASNPLMTIVKKDNYYELRYGNRRVTRLIPDFFNIESLNSPIEIAIDNMPIRKFKMGSVIHANHKFRILKNKNIRVNVIGFKQKNVSNEININISKEKINKNYSIDRHGKLFRVEFYKDKSFVGTIIIDFRDKIINTKNMLTLI